MDYTLEFGFDGQLYVVFPDENSADGMRWLFADILGMNTWCFNGYMNAYGYGCAT